MGDIGGDHQTGEIGLILEKLLQILNGDAADQLVLAVDHKIFLVVAADHAADQLGKGIIARHDFHIFIDYIFHPDAAQQVDVRPFKDVDPPAHQLHGVDRLLFEVGRQQYRNDAGGHQRGDDVVIVGQFKQDQDGANRSVGGAGHHRPHAHQGISAGIGGHPGHKVVCLYSHQCAEHRAHEQRGGKYPAGAPGTESGGGSDDLGQHQHRQQPGDIPPPEGIVHRFVSYPKHVGKKDPDQSHHQPPQGRLEVGGEGKRIKDILALVDRDDKQHCGQPGQNAQDGVGDELIRADQFIGRNGKGGKIADVVARDHRGGYRGDHDRAKLGDGKIADDHFHCKERSGDWGIEGGGDPGGGPAGHKGAQTAGGNRQRLSDHRTDRRADLHDGTFPAGRAAGTDGEGGGGDFTEDHPRTNAAPAQRHRFHHLRNAAPAHFPGDEMHDRSNQQPPQHRQQQAFPPGHRKHPGKAVLPGAEKYFL